MALVTYTVSGDSLPANCLVRLTLIRAEYSGRPGSDGWMIPRLRDLPQTPTQPLIMRYGSRVSLGQSVDICIVGVCVRLQKV